MSGMTEAELRELYQSYGPAVRARCRAVCGNEADADEALQDTFLRAWRARGRFDGRHPLAWLQTIARNASLDLVRKRRPWASDPEHWLRLPAAETGDPTARVDLARLLDSVSADDAAALRLRYVEDWRIRELAEHLDTSPRTLRRRLERLMSRARAIMGLPAEGLNHA